MTMSTLTHEPPKDDTERERACTSTWTLDDALACIRGMQGACMAAGYYIALAGGVLNYGRSNNDLDLVAVPRTTHADEKNLWCALNEFIVFEGTIQPLCTGAVWAGLYRSKRIEVSIISSKAIT